MEDTCIILLGASEFPRCPQLSANEAFLRSSRALLKYLEQVLGVSPSACLDLFDRPDGPAEQCDAIATFLLGQSLKSSVIVHYVGHGTFDDQRQHALLCRTSKERNWPSFLATRHLVQALREHAPDRRIYVFLDCCFAGAAASFQAGDEDLQARRVQELATRGLAFFTACPRNDVAIGPADEKYTRFTGAILRVLEEGIPGGPTMLSLEELNDRVRAQLRIEHGPTMPLPEIHRPDQIHGDPAKVPLFPNPAYRISTTDALRPRIESAAVTIAPLSGRRREDFSAAIRSTLAQRAAYRCSKPSCRVLTVGPSGESLESVASVGVAAHICAASPSGPRFDSTMTSDECASIENGIWLCAAHAVLIDRDVTRFSIEMLRSWKRQHEAYIKEHIGKVEPRMAGVKLGEHHLSDAAARIAISRERGWEYKLFNQMLRDEISTAHHVAKDLSYRIQTRPKRSIPLRVLVAELRRTNELAISLVSSITQLLGPAFSDAVGPAGVAGDPEAIAYVAGRLGAVYKSVMDNGVEWLHTSCDWDEDNAVVGAASRYLSGLALAIENLTDQLDRAIETASSREDTAPVPVKITIGIEISKEVSDALCVQIDKIVGFVSTHGWPENV